MQAFLDDIEAFFTGTAWTIVGFFATLLFGIIAIRITCKILRKALFKTSKSKTLCGFLLSIIRFALYLVLLFVLASIANISMTPLITALGAVGLAIGLALQDSISNIANGMIIVSTKPFTVGDLIEVAGEMGTVKAIRMITVELLTPDNRKVILPNSKVVSSNVVNYSARPTRRVEVLVHVHYDSDLRTVKQILLGELEKNEMVMENPAPYVILNDFKNHIELSARGWVNNQDYWAALWDLREQIFYALVDNGIQIPHGHTTVEIRNPRPFDASMDGNNTERCDDDNLSSGREVSNTSDGGAK